MIYKIHLDSKTVVSVNEHQIFKPRWIKYFGSVENIQLFIENYKPNGH